MACHNSKINTVTHNFFFSFGMRPYYITNVPNVNIQSWIFDIRRYLLNWLNELKKWTWLAAWADRVNLTSWMSWQSELDWLNERKEWTWLAEWVNLTCWMSELGWLTDLTDWMNEWNLLNGLTDWVKFEWTDWLGEIYWMNWVKFTEWTDWLSDIYWMDWPTEWNSPHPLTMLPFPPTNPPT